MAFIKGYVPWNKSKKGITGMYKRTIDIKNKISNSLLGTIPWNKGNSIGKEKLREHKSVYRQSFYVKQRFGITVEELNKFIEKYLEKNGQFCDICGREASMVGKLKLKGKRRLVVDHDHKSGKLRSIICDMCNIGLGMFEDNIENMEKAIEYLKIYKMKGELL